LNLIPDIVIGSLKSFIANYCFHQPSTARAFLKFLRTNARLA
jgi:hypothetical protein